MKLSNAASPRSIARALVLVGVALVLSACGSTTTSNNNPPLGASCTDQSASASPLVLMVTTGGMGPYGDTTTYAFNPACVIVAKGQSVTFTGDFTMHTILRSSQTVAAASNPLPAVVYTGPSPATFGPFNDSGDFNYYCTMHGGADGSGMAGIIRVKP
jgi:plastocyanin